MVGTTARASSSHEGSPVCHIPCHASCPIHLRGNTPYFELSHLSLPRKGYGPSNDLWSTLILYLSGSPFWGKKCFFLCRVTRTSFWSLLITACQHRKYSRVAPVGTACFVCLLLLKLLLANNKAQ